MNSDTESFDLLEDAFKLLKMSVECRDGDISKPLVNKIPVSWNNLIKKIYSGFTSVDFSDVAKNEFLQRVYRKDQEYIERSISQYLQNKIIKKSENISKDMKLVFLMRETEDLKESKFIVVNNKGIKLKIPPSYFIYKYGVENPMEVAEACFPIYNPFKPSGIQNYTLKTLAGDYKAINEYWAPPWMEYLGKVPPKLPEEIEILFSQIKEGMDRKYFYHFLHTMIWGRNSAFLILQGKGGIGKTIMKTVFKALVGYSNASDGSKRLVNSQFNANLERTRLTVCDEFSFGEKDVNTLKELPNPTMSVEAKHREASRQTDMYSSFILINNDERDNYITFEDRKFCPVELESRRLEEILTHEQINTITLKCGPEDSEGHDPEYIARIGAFLYDYGKDTKSFPQGEFKGRKFYSIANSNVKVWALHTIRFILCPEELLGREASKYTEDIKNGTIKMSVVQSIIVKAAKAGKCPSTVFPKDYSYIRNFMEGYRTVEGEKIFITHDIPNTYFINHDFMIETIPMKKKDKSGIVEAIHNKVNEKLNHKDPAPLKKEIIATIDDL